MNSKQQVFLRKVKGKIPRKKVLLRVLLVQTKNLQLQTVPIHQINQKKDVVSQPIEKPTESKQEPVVESTPTPEPTRPSYACPGGVNPDVSCDVIMDTNFYYATYSSQAEAEVDGMYYLDEVMYIGYIEITNYSVQPVYRNDHSIAYYGLNLWSNGSLIQ